MIINLHLGFPKTATTTLQNTVLPALSGVTYHGMHGGPNTDQRLRQYLAECWTKFQNGLEYEKELNYWSDQLAGVESDNVLISDETLMYWKSPRHPEASRWLILNNPSVDSSRSGSHPINEFLSMLSSRLPNGSQLKGIITLRNQADLLGSLAAEKGKSDPYFLERVLRTEDPSLAFHGIVKDLQATLGSENLLILFYEDGLEINSKTIADFVGAEIKQNTHGDSTRLNVKRLGDGVWKSAPTEPAIIALTVKIINETALGASLLGYLKRIAPWLIKLVPKFTRTVKISSDQRQRIQTHFRRDNGQLSELVGRDLRELGY